MTNSWPRRRSRWIYLSPETRRRQRPGPLLEAILLGPRPGADHPAGLCLIAAEGLALPLIPLAETGVLTDVADRYNRPVQPAHAALPIQDRLRRAMREELARRGPKRLSEVQPLIFNSVVFLSVFLPAVLLLYRLVPGRRGKDGFLCAASLVFYAFGGLGAIPVLLGSAVCSYAGGLILLGAAQRRKLACALAVAVLLGILCAYKYLDFLTGVVGSLLGIALPSPGLALPWAYPFSPSTGYPT